MGLRTKRHPSRRAIAEVAQEGISVARIEGSDGPLDTPAEERGAGCATCTGHRDIRAECQFRICVGHIAPRAQVMGKFRVDSHLSRLLPAYAPGETMAPRKCCLIGSRCDIASLVLPLPGGL